MALPRLSLVVRPAQLHPGCGRFRRQPRSQARAGVQVRRGEGQSGPPDLAGEEAPGRDHQGPRGKQVGDRREVKINLLNCQNIIVEECQFVIKLLDMF